MNTPIDNSGRIAPTGPLAKTPRPSASANSHRQAGRATGIGALRALSHNRKLVSARRLAKGQRHIHAPEAGLADVLIGAKQDHRGEQRRARRRI